MLSGEDNTISRVLSAMVLGSQEIHTPFPLFFPPPVVSPSTQQRGLGERQSHRILWLCFLVRDKDLPGFCIPMTAVLKSTSSRTRENMEMAPSAGFSPKKYRVWRPSSHLTEFLFLARRELNPPRSNSSCQTPSLAATLSSGLTCSGHN